MHRWERDPWPGNVRALRNAVARWLALGELAATMPSPSPQRAAEARTGPGFIDTVLDERLPLIQAREKVVAEFERRYVERTLDEHDGNVARAAAASGIARRHFQRIKAKRRD